MTANAMACTGALEAASRVDTGIERMPGGRLVDGGLVHPVTAGPMRRIRHPVRAGLSTMRSAKGKRRCEQDQQADEIGPRLRHSAGNATQTGTCAPVRTAQGTALVPNLHHEPEHDARGFRPMRGEQYEVGHRHPRKHADLKCGERESDGKHDWGAMPIRKEAGAGQQHGRRV